MAANSSDSRNYQASLRFLVDVVRNVPYGIPGFTYTGEMPVAGGVSINFSHGVSFSSWGEKITVTLIDMMNYVRVDIYSECSLPTQIIDWGKNRENVHNVIRYIDSRVASYQEAPNEEPQPEPQPVQVPELPPRRLFPLPLLPPGGCPPPRSAGLLS